MLSDSTIVPTLAVSDVEAARRFYEDVLGFPAGEESPEGVVYTLGPVSLLVYRSAYAGTNKATALSIRVPLERFDEDIDALRSKGVSFQTFEMEGVTWADDVASIGDERAVWFEDPAGNILNVAAQLPR